MLHWLIATDGGLMVRILIGACIFASLGAADLIRHRGKAQRWREYSVLLAAVALALVYGAVNDQITSRISWEYFYYGKELFRVLGPATPPDRGAMSWEAAKVGLKATWSAGLVFGVILLLANNPYHDLPRLRNRELLRPLLVIPCTAVCLGLLFGFLGYLGGLNWLSSDFQDMAHADVFRPRRFMTTWGIHLGDYIGGAIGTAIASIRVITLRRSRR